MRMKKSYVNAQTSSFERNVAAPQLGATALLMVTRGLGHKRLLADPVVVRAVVDFVAQETPAQEMRGNACTM